MLTTDVSQNIKSFKCLDNISAQATQLCTELHQNNVGFFGVRHALNQKAVYTHTQKIRDGKDVQKLLYYAIDNSLNQDISCNTFKHRNATGKENLANIGTIGVKIAFPEPDVSKAKNEFWKILDYLESSGNEGITPSFAVCSKNLYFLYKLEHSFYIGNISNKKKQNLFKFIKHIQNGICEIISEAFSEYDVQPLNLAAYIPIPGFCKSDFYLEFNEKNEKKWKLDKRYMNEIMYHESSRAFDINVLADACITRFKNWKKKNYRISLKKKEYFTVSKMLSNRLKLLKTLRDNDWFKTNETLIETAIFLYCNFSMQLYGDWEKAEFNTKAFFNEIPEIHKMKKKFHMLYGAMKQQYGKDHKLKKYKYKNETFLLSLCLSEEKAKELGFEMRTAEEKRAYDREYSRIRRELDRQEQIKKKETCTQKIMIKAKKAAKMLTNGLSRAEVCKKLQISLSTLKRYIGRMINFMDAETAPI